MAKEILILSPVKGKVKDIAKVDDEMFAQEMMGPGMAVTPAASTTEFVSPIVKGKVVTAFETGHAYGVLAKPAEILLHIGIDTVNLEGKGFDMKVEAGAKVKKDTTLVNVDMKEIKKAKSIDSMIIVTNFADLEKQGWKLEKVASGAIEAGDVLMKLTK